MKSIHAVHKFRRQHQSASQKALRNRLDGPRTPLDDRLFQQMLQSNGDSGNVIGIPGSHHYTIMDGNRKRFYTVL